jgi:carotenoid cleavage dioxygenase-like enzyme
MNEYNLGFTSLDHEIKIDALPISGKIPAWLSGSLLRTGPAKFETTTRKLNHWFDGFAMLHKFNFKDGVVAYQNTFLETKAFLKSQEDGRVHYREFATDPCKSIFAKVQSLFVSSLTDNANVNIAKFADRYMSLTETTLPVEFDREHLKTLGVYKFPDAIGGQITTAHPHFDFAAQRGFSYAVKLSAKSHYQIYRIEGDKRTLLNSIPVERPSYMHSFGMTERYLILVEYPIVVNALDLLISGKPFIENYRWQPERATTFLVIDKKSGDLAATLKGDPFFAFHHINAFESGDTIALDIASYENSSIIQALYLDALRKDTSEGTIPPSYPTRYMLNVKTKTVTAKRLSDAIIELPVMNYEHYQMKPYKYIYGIQAKERGDFWNALAKVDVVSGKIIFWAEPGTYAGEPVFVQAPGASDEDDGVILSVVLNTQENNSFLVILDAKTFQEIGRAVVPHHIPFGFHGNFYA